MVPVFVFIVWHLNLAVAMVLVLIVALVYS